MAQGPSYWQKLKDPRWQKARLEVLQRADFSCEDCGATDKTLEIHHSYYERGLDPWEYPPHSLHALCRECHAAAQGRMVDLHRAIGDLDLSSISILIGYARALGGVGSIIPSEMEEFYGIADYCGSTPGQISQVALDNGCEVPLEVIQALFDKKPRR